MTRFFSLPHLTRWFRQARVVFSESSSHSLLLRGLESPRRREIQLEVEASDRHQRNWRIVD